MTQNIVDMKSILIPTNFSESANNAYLYALHLANHLDLKVYVVYCYIPPVLSATHGGQPELLQSVYEEIELSKFDSFKNNVSTLRELAEKNNLDSSNVIFLFEEGTLINTIKKTVEKEDIYAVVMGTSGASGFAKAIIGTNTVDVINNIKKPVLAIPSHAKFKPIEKVAFTTLFREKDKTALQEIVNIADKIVAETYCIHVMDNADNPADALLHTDDWGQLYKNSNLEFILLEKNGSVENTINSFIQEQNIDVLAIVKRNRNLFDRLINTSLSNQFVFHSQTPIWVFHEEN